MLQLITTFEPGVNHSSPEIVYLGPWCIENGRTNSDPLAVSNCMNLSNPSMDERLRRVHHVDQVAERISLDLAHLLNDLHQTEHDILYWQTCVGYWLAIFLDSLYDRWANAQSVKDYGKPLSLESLQVSDSGTIPNTTSEFNLLSQTEKWNRFIFEQALSNVENVKIVTGQKLNPVEVAICEGPPILQTSNSARQKIRWVINAIAKRSPYVLCTTYLPKRAEWKLALMLGSVPLYWVEPMRSQQVDLPSFREHLALPITGDEFERFARKLICKQIPRSFVERYASIRSGITTSFGRKYPKAIFTSNLHLSSDSFSIWTAEARNHGCKLLISQHGGLNGQGLFPTRAETHETRIADCHLPWGWKVESTRARNIPALINVGRKEFGNQSEALKLLIITDCTYRYGRQPWMTSIDNQTYLANVQTLVAELPKEIYKQTIVRLHHHYAEYDYSQSLLWSKIQPEIAIDFGSRPIDELRRTSRLAICTTLGTSEIEQFARNFPTVLMLDPQTHPIRENCQSLFSRMQSVGLVHESPKSASEHITNIWSDANTWWLQDEIQALVAEYLHRFGRKHEHPLRELKKVVTSISNS